MDKRIAIAILDSGIDYSATALRSYQFRHFDFTDEGPTDFNGHGTMAAKIALGVEKNAPIDPASVVVLNIKILNKFLDLTEVTLLRGLEQACQEGVAFRATVINLSCGIKKPKRGDCYACKIFRQLVRRNRNKNVCFVIAAGNDGTNLDTTDRMYVPQMCTSIEVPPDNQNVELFEDALYFASRGEYDQAESVMVAIAANNPSKEIKTELIAFNQTVLFVQLSINARRLGQTDVAEHWLKSARESNHNFLDLSELP